MKPSYILPLTLLLLIASCSSNESIKFTGEWQQLGDPSKKIIITSTNDTYSFTTQNIESSVQDVAGIYNAEKNSLEFDNGAGTITTFVYDKASDNLLAFGEKFAKSTADAGGEETEVTNEEVTAEETSDVANNADPSGSGDPVDNASKCDKGETLMITGNNVRLRTEPDVTKQNILLQLNKGNEVVRLGDRNVDSQKWYKVCFGGNIGWVSGQYASMK